MGVGSCMLGKYWKLFPLPHITYTRKIKASASFPLFIQVVSARESSCSRHKGPACSPCCWHRCVSSPSSVASILLEVRRAIGKMIEICRKNPIITQLWRHRTCLNRLEFMRERERDYIFLNQIKHRSSHECLDCMSSSLVRHEMACSCARFSSVAVVIEEIFLWMKCFSRYFSSSSFSSSLSLFLRHHHWMKCVWVVRQSREFSVFLLYWFSLCCCSQQWFDGENLS